MKTISVAGLALTAVGVIHVGPAIGQRAERISPSITLQQHIDPIEDTDFSSVRIESGDGSGYSYPAEITIHCFGRRSAMWVGYDEPVVQPRNLVWRIDSARPDTLPLPQEPEMRAYGSSGLWLVFYRPLEIVSVPESIIPRLISAARAGSRLVVRVDTRDGRRDSHFNLIGLSRGLDRLSCLRGGTALGNATHDGRLLGNPLYWDQEDLDEVPIPVDSASTVLALRREVPSSEIASRTLGYVYGTISINSTGQVDSVDFTSDRRDVTSLVRFLESIHFHPGQRNGQPVPSRIGVYIQVADPRR